MKKIVLILICSCNNLVFAQEATDIIIGEWQVNFDKTLQEHSPSKQQQYDSLDVAIQNSMKSQLASQSFNFKEDSRFTIFLENDQSYNGSWVLEENLILELHYDQGSQLKSQVKSLSSDYIILKIDHGNDGAFFDYIYLEPLTSDQ